MDGLGNVRPPPDASPEEIEAWNNMMDTMVTFIKASTHLMNTITQKVISGGGGGSRYATSAPTYQTKTRSGCESECNKVFPKPAPPCGICGKPEDAKKASSVAAKSSSSVPAPAASPDKPASKDSSIYSDARGEGEIPAPAEPAPTEPPEADPATDEAVDIVTQPLPEAPSEQIQPQKSETKEKTDSCPCSEIRAKREATRGGCICSKDDEDTTTPPELPPEIQCGCGPTEGNRQYMVQEMIEKLAAAQKEITQLQEEMARLQRMDAARKTSGPNPAALYKAIMKDNEEAPSLPRMGTSRSCSSNPEAACLNKSYITPIRPPGRPIQCQMYPGMRRNPGGFRPMEPFSRNQMRPMQYGPVPSFDGGSYWNRTGEYGGSQIMDSGGRDPVQVVCTNKTIEPPQRRKLLICGPPHDMDESFLSDGCDPGCGPPL